MFRDGRGVDPDPARAQSAPVGGGGSPLSPAPGRDPSTGGGGIGGGVSGGGGRRCAFPAPTNGSRVVTNGETTQ